MIKRASAVLRDAGGQIGPVTGLLPRYPAADLFSIFALRISILNASKTLAPARNSRVRRAHIVCERLPPLLPEQFQKISLEQCRKICAVKAGRPAAPGLASCIWAAQNLRQGGHAAVRAQNQSALVKKDCPASFLD